MDENQSSRTAQKLKISTRNFILVAGVLLLTCSLVGLVISGVALPILSQQLR